MALILIVLGISAAILPYLDRLETPSLHGDDFVRLIQLRTEPLPRLLFLPFNEHMAPLFQGISWLTWQSIGGRLAWAPHAFTWASLVPYVGCLWLLIEVVRRETGSLLTALTSLAIFSQSFLACETVDWYSASSFTWALAWTLAAYRGAIRATDGRRQGVWLMFTASALAPACSAIGLLAGPLAALRVMGRGSQGEALRGRSPLVPALAGPIGTSLNLLVCSTFQYGDVLAQSWSRHIHEGAVPGLAATLRAPGEFLLPGLFGLAPHFGRYSAEISLALVGVLAIQAWRSRHRPLIVMGLCLILAGYAITLIARSGPGEPPIDLAHRYHLFPQAGLALALAPLVRAALRRFFPRPWPGVLAVTAVTAVLALTHAPCIVAWGWNYRYPDQVATLSALDRLGSTCRHEGISRAQIVAAMAPVRCREWSTDLNLLLIVDAPERSTAPPDLDVRRFLLSTLRPADQRLVAESTKTAGPRRRMLR